MNRRKYFIFDFETDGVDPHSCNPVQVAAVVIDPLKLEIIPGSEFNTMMKPPGIDKDDYFTDERNGTIMFHSVNQKKTPEEIVQIWKDSPEQDLAWDMFVNYIKKWNPKQDKWNAPIPGGANIADFDLPIAKRLNEKYGVNNETLFWQRDCDYADVQRLAYMWFEGVSVGPPNYKVDTLREFFQMEMEGSHDALKDVQDCAELIIRFLSLTRHCAARVEKFREYHNAFVKKNKDKKKRK